MDPKAKARFARIKALIDGKKVPNTNSAKVPGTRRHRHRQTSARQSHTSNIQTKDDVKKDFLKYIEDKQSDSLPAAEKLMDYIDKNWDAEDIRKAYSTIQLEGMGKMSILNPKEDTKNAMDEFYLGTGTNKTPNGVRMAGLMKLVRNMKAIEKNEKQTLKKQLSDDGKKLFTKANAGEEITMVDNPLRKEKRASIGGKTRKRRRKKKRRTRKRRRTKKKRKRRRRKRRRTRK